MVARARDLRISGRSIVGEGHDGIRSSGDAPGTAGFVAGGFRPVLCWLNRTSVQIHLRIQIGIKSAAIRISLLHRRSDHKVVKERVWDTRGQATVDHAT